MDATIKLDHELLAVEAEHSVHAMLELTAPAAPEGRERPPLHLALVIDRSGSMDGPKLETAKRCADFLARRLAPTDELGVVAFDEQVRLVAPLTAGGDEALRHAIAGLYPGGSTNLSGGWFKGLELLRGLPGPDPRRILLLTDGLANVGVTDAPSLVTLATKARAKGVGTTTIGFGEGFDEDLLTRMADGGGGNAHYAATVDEAPGIFATEFEGLLALVAQNVSVEIRPTEHVQVMGILNEYPAVGVAGGVQVQLGDAYGDERRRVVFELHVPGMAALGPAKVAHVVVRYVSVGEEMAAHEVTMPLTVNLVSADEAAAAGPDQDVLEEVVILKAARAQEEARRDADRGDFDAASTKLRGAAEELRRMAPASARGDELLAEAEALGESAAMMAPASYNLQVRKTMTYRTHEARRRRRPKP